MRGSLRRQGPGANKTEGMIEPWSKVPDDVNDPSLWGQEPLTQPKA
jgi:hypothetical protein